MKFRIKADAEFEADNIDDAFMVLARHFLSVYAGEDDNCIELGEIHIERITEEEEKLK
jgi:hypothetical protein